MTATYPTARTTPRTGVFLGWDVKANTGHGQANFGDQVFPAGDEPPLVLSINGDEVAPFNFSLGASNPSTIDSSGGGARAGKVNLSDLSLSGAAGVATAGLLRSVSAGVHIPRVTLGVRDPEGRVFRTITLPLAGRGLAAAIALAFGRALGEFGATVIVAGNIPGRTQTLALAIFSEIQLGDTDAALRLVAITVVIAWILMGVVERLLRRGPRAEEAR